MSDLLAALDVQLAKALRALDLAGTLADALARQTPKRGWEDDRVQESIRRVNAVRAALISAGIPLPPLRELWMKQERYGLGGSSDE